MSNIIFNLAMFYCDTLQWINNHILTVHSKLWFKLDSQVQKIYLHYHQDETNDE